MIHVLRVDFGGNGLDAQERLQLELRMIERVGGNDGLLGSHRRENGGAKGARVNARQENYRLVMGHLYHASFRWGQRKSIIGGRMSGYSGHNHMERIRPICSKAPIIVIKLVLGQG
jgi:hypothetical protein